MGGAMIKIVSGGQTGVDRAALDAAISMQVEHGGWCPRGRIAEDGCIGKQYILRETRQADYETRTEANVMKSDGTLVLCRHRPDGGTLLTILLCAIHGKPVLLIQPKAKCTRQHLLKTLSWIEKNGIKVLNVAGPRASKDAGIYGIAYDFIRIVLENVSSRLV